MCHSSDSHISTDKIGADCAMNDDKITCTHTRIHGHRKKMQQKKSSTSRNNTEDKKHDRSVAQYYTLDNKDTSCHLATNNVQRFLTILHSHIAHLLGARLIKQAVGGRPPRYAPAQACKWWHDIRHVRIGHHYCMSCQYNQPKRPGDLDLLTLKVVPESCATWATSVPILVLLGFSVLELGPMYATDRQTSDKNIA